MALMDYMSVLSDDYYSAGWIQGLESMLWRVLQGDREAFAGGVLKDEEVEKLRALSAACNGWIDWEKDKGEVFVPLDEWKTRFNSP